MLYLKHLFPLCVLIGGVYGCSKSRIVQSPTVKTYAYVGDYYNLFTCTVNQATGQFDGCQDSGYYQFTFAQGISELYPTVAIAAVGSKTYAYISNYNDGSIYQCLIDPTTGLFTGCGPSGGTGLTHIWGLASNTAPNGNTYIYARWNGGINVSQCSINQTTGQLSCNTISTAFSGDVPSIVFNAIAGNKYVYLPTDGNTVQVCDVNFDGTFSNCQNPATAGFGATYGITFVSSGNQVNAYVADYNANSVLQCAVSPIDGSLYNCSPSFGNDESFSIASLLLDGQWFVYSVGYGGGTEINSVIKCGVNNSTADLENCADSGMGPLFYTDDDGSLPITFTNFTY